MSKLALAGHPTTAPLFRASCTVYCFVHEICLQIQRECPDDVPRSRDEPRYGMQPFRAP
jgi:hypothetical protein